jgi:hypothetical protein
MRRFVRRPSPSMVVAFIALLVALGGTSYAIQALPSNSVGSKQLKNNAVTSKKLKNGAVTSKKLKNGAVNSDKVKNGSLLSADFKSGQLPAGPQGAQGPKGETGQTGARGETGPSDAYSAMSCLPAIAPPCTTNVVVPAGQYAVTAKTNAANSTLDATSTGGIQCQLTASNQAGTAVDDFGNASYVGGARGTATAARGFTIGAGGGTITYNCNSQTGSNILFRNVVTAIKVGALH